MFLQDAFWTQKGLLIQNKLFKIGFRGLMNYWFKTYLMGRKLCIKVGDFLGDHIDLKKDVPQGSVLGPTLFIIYITSIFDLKLKRRMIGFTDNIVIASSSSNMLDLQYNISFNLHLLRYWFLLPLF